MAKIMELFYGELGSFQTLLLLYLHGFMQEQKELEAEKG